MSIVGIKRRADAHFIGLVATGFALFFASSERARADSVVVAADHFVDVLKGRIVDRPRITITDGRIAGIDTSVR